MKLAETLLYLLSLQFVLRAGQGLKNLCYESNSSHVVVNIAEFFKFLVVTYSKCKTHQKIDKTDLKSLVNVNMGD